VRPRAAQFGLEQWQFRILHLEKLGSLHAQQMVADLRGLLEGLPENGIVRSWHFSSDAGPDFMVVASSSTDRVFGCLRTYSALKVPRPVWDWIWSATREPPFPARFAIFEARQTLAARFGLPFGDAMQDWEIEVAMPTRLFEFLSAYSSWQIDDDERFSLAQVIIQSLEESEDDHHSEAVVDILVQDFHLHATTVWYWAQFDEWRSLFRVTPMARLVLRRIRQRDLDSTPSADGCPA
jgi:hypothetical protein